jgi:hypothetical protein
METAMQDQPKTDRQKDDETDAGVTPPSQRDTKSPSSGRGRSRARKKATPDVARRLDPELSGRLTGIILPVVTEFSDAIMQAIGPVLQSYQDELARLMVEQVKAILPTIQQEMEREAKARVAQALQAMRADESTPAPPPSRGGRGQNRAPQPRPRARRSGPTQSQSAPAATPADQSAEQDTATTQSQNEVPGGTTMTTDTAQSEQATDETSDQNQQEQQSTQQSSQPQAQQTEGAQATDGDQGSEGTGASDSGQQPSSQTRSNRPARGQAQRPTYYYDPQAAARTGLLQLATAWKEAGSTYQAINAYMRILTRYPQTGTAAAATEGLVDLATRLEQQGMFYAALSIYEKLEGVL